MPLHRSNWLTPPPYSLRMQSPTEKGQAFPTGQQPPDARTDAGSCSPPNLVYPRSQRGSIVVERSEASHSFSHARRSITGSFTEGRSVLASYGMATGISRSQLGWRLPSQRAFPGTNPQPPRGLSKPDRFGRIPAPFEVFRGNRGFCSPGQAEIRFNGVRRVAEILLPA
jgi:hypothetical protein